MLVADLVKRKVALIAVPDTASALAAKAATTTIPIVFIVGFDPVADGLVASFSRPGGNATGIFLVTALVGQKRLEILRELNPKASTVALLVNPVSPDAPPEIKDVEAAAQANRISIKHFNASTPAEIDAAFTSITAQRPDGLLCGSDPFFVVRREQIITHVAQLKMPDCLPIPRVPSFRRPH